MNHRLGFILGWKLHNQKKGFGGNADEQSGMSKGMYGATGNLATFFTFTLDLHFASYMFQRTTSDIAASQLEILCNSKYYKSTTQEVESS